MNPFWEDSHLQLWGGDCREVLRELPDESVHCVVTSPPYWGLRDYGTASWDGGDPECDHISGPARNDITPERLAERAAEYGTGQGAGSAVAGKQFSGICGKCGARRIDSQLGLEATPEEFVANMVGVFREVRRVLRRDGTLWLNLGDSYANGPASGTAGQWNGSSPLGANRNAEASVAAGRQVKRPDNLKPKDLVGIPWRVAFALQADGWYLRSDIIWAKPNPMPESVTDRPTKAHEYLFLLTRSPRYYYDAEAVREAYDPATVDRRKYPVGHTGSARSNQIGARQPGRTYTYDVTDQRGPLNPAGRNLRSVWSIATEPYPNVKIKNDVGPDGIPGTVSQGCPVHSPLVNPRTQRTAEGDAPLGPDPSRSPDIGARLDPAPVPELPASSGPDSQGARQPTPGLSRPGSSVSPIRESALASRTPALPIGDDGLAATAQSTPRTSHSQGEPTSPADAGTTDGAAATGRNGHESRTTDESAALGSSGHSTAAHTSDMGVATLALAARCSCPDYISTSHFATFPRKLVEPCVKAGTSERGVCPECGAPWVRVVERGNSEHHHRAGCGHIDIGSSDFYDGGAYGGFAATARDTGAWRASCTHEAEPVPAVVLDPFAGSGTTLFVAQALGRRGVGIDLSPDYLKQALERNRQTPLGLVG